MAQRFCMQEPQLVSPAPHGCPSTTKSEARAHPDVAGINKREQMYTQSECMDYTAAIWLNTT